MGDYLVLIPVRDLKVDEMVVDEFGERRITAIRSYNKGSFIEFNEGPPNWYHHSELFPVERLS